MSRGWASLLVVGSLVVSIVLGVVVGYSARYLSGLFASDDVRYRMAALFVCSALLVLLVAGIWKGLHYATYNVLPVTAALAVAAGLSAIVSGTGTGIVAFLTVVFVMLAAVIVGSAVLVRAMAGTAGRLVFTVVAISGALASGAMRGGLIGTLIAISAMVMARRSAHIEADYPTLARWTTAIACRGGTRFRNADLRGANLEHAHLYACDFRGARLDGARFEHATMELCRTDPVRAAI